MNNYPDIGESPKSKDEATFESRYATLLLWLTIVFAGLVIYAIEGGW